MDGHPGGENSRDRVRQAGRAGKRAQAEGHRSGRSRASGGAGHQAQPRRPVRPPPSRKLHFCGPHRRGQDRAGQAAGRTVVRRSRPAHPSGHERVHGKIRGVPYDRFSSGLCGLRGSRSADREGAPPPVQCGAVRRDRKGAPGRDEHSAADPRRGQDQRCAGTHGGFFQHSYLHDLQRRQQRPERGQPWL